MGVFFIFWETGSHTRDPWWGGVGDNDDDNNDDDNNDDNNSLDCKSTRLTASRPV